MKQRNSGMTVVDCVVVVAGIAFLLLILLPVRSRPRRGSAQRDNCVANLKQLGLGIAQNYDDNTNQMPPMTSVQSLAASLAPYIGSSTRLFVCPGDRDLKPVANISNLTESSYAWIPTAVWQQSNVAVLAFDKLQPSGLTVLTGSNSWSRKSAHGGEGGCVLFTDGHAEWMRVLDVGTNRYPVVND